MRALELRPSLRIPLLAVMAFVLSFAFAGTADAKKKKKKNTLPTVTRVAPMKLAVGDRLVIKGKNFRAGAATNTIIFRKSTGGPLIFAKTLTASKKLITLEVPERVRAELDVVNGAPQPTRFQLRVVSARANGGFTALSKSPIILPQPGGSAGADCDGDGINDALDADDDNDGLMDATELQYGMNICSKDTDGDGVEDLYEFESALDLNIRALPYPFRTPWPNPLVNEREGGFKAMTPDGLPDFDGDGLSLGQEHTLWQAAGRPVPLNYSDGQQHTNGFVAAPVPDTFNQDIDAVGYRPGEVGWLSDDERDYDGDGLSNMVEFNTQMTQSWWTAYSEGKDEVDYTLRPFTPASGFVSDPSMADTDGDGLIDSLDDIDGDGWNNAAELFRAATPLTGGNAYMVNPFNPCLPDYRSKACSRYVPFEDPWAPFDLEGGLPLAPIGWVNDGPANAPAGDFTP